MGATRFKKRTMTRSPRRDCAKRAVVRFLQPALVLALCLFLSACSTGPALVKATGTVLNDGKPFTIGKGGSVTLVFIPIVEGDQHYNSPPTKMKAEDSSFTFSQGIPPGKYRVQVMQMVLPTSPEIDEMNQRFSKENSKIVVEVKDEKTPIIIDLAKTPQ